MSEPIRSVDQLKVYQMSMDLAELSFEMADSMPPHDQFGLAHQIRKSSVSIPSNIAEGFGRGSRVDYARFLGYALTSARELETQHKLAARTRRATPDKTTLALDWCDQIQRMLRTMIRRLTT